MKTNISIISKESTTEQIRKYFTKVLDLSKKNGYPVNLNEVWALVYNQKSDAVKVLKKDFIEGIDYQVLRQIPQNPKGGRPSEEYVISVPCLEFFIARKIRPIFDVYRKVFHAKVNGVISARLKKEIQSLHKYSQAYSRSLKAKFGIEYELYPELILGNKWDDSKCLEDNIKTLLGVIRYNTAGGIFQAYKAYDYQNKYKELKEDVHKALHEITYKIEM